MSTDYSDIKETLERMCNFQPGWLRKYTHGRRTDIYTITDHGKRAVETITRLLQEENPLKELDAFYKIEF
jgi:DNA-binding PadR family transcriptional regulator